MNRVFSNGVLNLDVRVIRRKLGRTCEIHGHYSYPWIFNDLFNRNGKDYLSINQENKLIFTGNNIERKYQSDIREEVYGKNICERCGTNLSVKPWLKIYYDGLCRRCSNELDEEFTNRKPWA